MTITPEQFKILATKEDLKNFVPLGYFDHRMDEMMLLLDGIAKDMKDLKQEMVFSVHRMDHIENRVDKIEDRLHLRMMET